MIEPVPTTVNFRELTKAEELKQLTCKEFRPNRMICGRKAVAMKVTPTRFGSEDTPVCASHHLILHTQVKKAKDKM